MKLTFFITAFILTTTQFISLANEPFVVLNYRNHENIDSGKKVDKNNPFLKNSNHSVSHIVTEGDSLSGIINQYYSNTGLNKKILEVSIIEINTHAFVRKNPHYLFAGKKLRIPSINEIMQLVKNKPSKIVKSNDRSSHIYFFGGN